VPALDAEEPVELWGPVDRPDRVVDLEAPHAAHALRLAQAFLGLLAGELGTPAGGHVLCRPAHAAHRVAGAPDDLHPRLEVAHVIRRELDGGLEHDLVDDARHHLREGGDGPIAIRVGDEGEHVLDARVAGEPQPADVTEIA